MPLTNVRVVSSIPIPPPLRGRFETGLGSSAVWMDGLGYAFADLVTTGLRGANHGDTLIATVGGLIAGQALLGTGFQFISLVGGSVDGFPPNDDTGNFKGGISFETFVGNPSRIGHLRDHHGIPEAHQGLLFNTHSSMSAAELLDFPPSRRFPVTLDQTNAGGAAALFTQAFRAIESARMEAVVVSADPFFFSRMLDLIGAANTWTDLGGSRRVCYPLLAYGAAGPRHHTVHAPVLDVPDAYQSMGSKAAAILRVGATTFDRLGLGPPADH
jgi:hypothetical protein